MTISFMSAPRVGVAAKPGFVEWAIERTVRRARHGVGQPVDWPVSKRVGNETTSIGPHRVTDQLQERRPLRHCRRASRRAASIRASST